MYYDIMYYDIFLYLIYGKVKLKFHFFAEITNENDKEKSQKKKV